jgi:TolA-binding protein
MKSPARLPIRRFPLVLGAVAALAAALPALPGMVAPAIAQSVTAAPPPPADLSLAQRRISELEIALRDANQVADELNRENFRLRLENDRLKQALDTAQRAAQSAGPPLEPPTPTPPPPAPATSQTGETAAFNAARSLAARDPAAAEAALRAFIQTYPNAATVGEATYLLGRTQYVQRKWNAAATTFLDIVEKTPRAPRAPEASIWLGAALRADGVETNNLQKIRTGCGFFRDLRERFPAVSETVRQQAAQELAWAATPGGRAVCTGN